MSPRKNESKFKLPKYDHLYQYPDRPGIYYKRWSPEKQRTFVYSTGYDDPKEASKIGTKEYLDWLGAHVDSRGLRLIRDFARAVLATKEARKGGKAGSTYESARVQIMNHIIPAFGHLKPSEITPLRWETYDAVERKRVHHREGRKDPVTGKRQKVPYTRTKLANTRKHLLEILRRAMDEGLIKQVPKLKNNDGKPAPPRYIPRAIVLELIRAAGRARRTGHTGRGTKFLIYLLWKMGARPGEVLQYRWSMFRREPDGTWFIDIPAEITKTNRARSIPLNRRLGRLIAWLRPRLEPLGACLFPSPSDPSRPILDYSSGWDTACRRVGVDFDAYNLRDTFITDAIKRKESLSDIARYVDNSAAIIDQKYAVALRESLKGVAGP